MATCWSCPRLQFLLTRSYLPSPVVPTVLTEVCLRVASLALMASFLGVRVGFVLGFEWLLRTGAMLLFRRSWYIDVATDSTNVPRWLSFIPAVGAAACILFQPVCPRPRYPPLHSTVTVVPSEAPISPAPQLDVASPAADAQQALLATSPSGVAISAGNGQSLIRDNADLHGGGSGTGTRERVPDLGIPYLPLCCFQVLWIFQVLVTIGLQAFPCIVAVNRDTYPSPVLALTLLSVVMYCVVWLWHVMPTAWCTERVHAVLRALDNRLQLTERHVDDGPWVPPSVASQVLVGSHPSVTLCHGLERVKAGIVASPGSAFWMTEVGR